MVQSQQGGRFKPDIDKLETILDVGQFCECDNSCMLPDLKRMACVHWRTNLGKAILCYSI